MDADTKYYWCVKQGDGLGAELHGFGPLTYAELHERLMRLCQAVNSDLDFYIYAADLSSRQHLKSRWAVELKEAV